jgi:hypothetical protein
MSLEQKPSGRFNKGLRKVQAAQAEARSLAIREYAVRVRAAVDALDQSSDEGTLMMSMQRYHKTVTREIFGPGNRTGAPSRREICRTRSGRHRQQLRPGIATTR